MSAGDGRDADRNAAGASVIAFGVYLIALGSGLLIAPNAMLALFRQPPTAEPWLRVLGLVAAVLGGYYVAAGWSGTTAFFRWSVHGRMVGAVGFAALVALRIAPAFVLLMAALDAAGAAWTWSSMRRSR
jgi:xanthosine utilization system XapX-like protein